MSGISRAFFEENRRRVLEALPEGSLALLFSGNYRQRSEDDNMPFTPNRNYYYLTGQKNIGGILLLSKTKTACAQILFVERPTPRKVLYKGPFPTHSDYTQATGIAEIRYLDELESTIAGLMARQTYSSFYGDFQRFRFDATQDLPQAMARRIREDYPNLRIESIRPIVCNMRRVKSQEEQAMLRRAGELTVEAVCDLVGEIRPDLWTYSLYSRFNYYLGYHYGEGPSFQSVITTGEDCLALHCFETFNQLRDGDLVLVDVGAEYQLYASDICRMYPVSGVFTSEQRWFYQAVIDAEEAVAGALRPGLPMGEIPVLADAVLADRLRQAGLIEHSSEVRRYLDHGIYHFVGLDAHDVGDECVLEPGMVISVEPGLYIPEKGLGVRVEDNYLITQTGAVCLTAALPKTPGEIEQQMRAVGRRNPH